MAGLLRPESTFVALHPEVVRQIGSTAANVLGYIAYVESDQGALLTAKQISTGTGVSVSTVKRLTARLREQGVLTAERAEPWNSTLAYRVAWDHPVVAGQPESVTLGLSGVSECSSRETQGGAPLLSEHEELPTPPVVPPSPAAIAAVIPASEEPPVSVPESYQEPLLPAVGLALVPDPQEPEGPPKTAQTLVARWCDGYRTSHGGADAAGPVMKRVAGQMRNLAKACGDSHPDWVAAYTAAFQTGQQGRTDPVTVMAGVRRTGRTTNVWASPSLGGTGTAAQAVSALLAGSPAPQQLSEGER